jgi:hypothetical protein
MDIRDTPDRPWGEHPPDECSQGSPPPDYKPRWMKVLVSVIVLVLLLDVTWCLWRLHPWMRPGQAVHVVTWRLGEYEVQVWQRKNADLFEPFATGLFVRRSGSKWQVFLLDHQDLYAPRIALKRESVGVVVFRGSKRLGVLEEGGRYRRESDGAMLTGALLQAEPPSIWWLKQ